MAITVKLQQIVANPYRDMAKYPISRTKVEALKESMKQTGFWENIIGRPAGNTVSGVKPEALVSHLQGLRKAFDDDGTPLFNIELGYGHHRWVALQELGIEELEIPVKSISEENMLKIMANENKGDWGANMSVILETVRQTRQYLLDQVKDFATYDEYAAAGGEFFSKEQFVQIPEQGIGFRQIRKFLGETWAEADIRHAVAVLKDIDDGLYEQEQVIGFPSIGVLGTFAKVAGGIKAQGWPEFFKRKMIDDIATMICDPAISTTVKTLKSAQDAVKDGKDPVRVVKNPGLKRVDFDVVKEIKSLVYENMDPKAPKLNDIAELEGFKGYEGLAQILEDVQKSINRSEAAKSAVPASKPGEGSEGEPEAGALLDQGELDQVIADAEASKAVMGEATTPAELGNLPAYDEKLEGVSVDELGQRFTHSAAHTAATIDALIPLLGEIEAAEHPVFTAAEVLFKKVAQLVVSCYSAQDAAAMLAEVTEVE